MCKINAPYVKINMIEDVYLLILHLTVRCALWFEKHGIYLKHCSSIIQILVNHVVLLLPS